MIPRSVFLRSHSIPGSSEYSRPQGVYMWWCLGQDKENCVLAVLAMTMTWKRCFSSVPFYNRSLHVNFLFRSCIICIFYSGTYCLYTNTCKLDVGVGASAGFRLVPPCFVQIFSVFSVSHCKYTALGLYANLCSVHCSDATIGICIQLVTFYTESSVCGVLLMKFMKYAAG